MQTLQTKHKIAISMGVIGAIVAAGGAMSASLFAQFDANDDLTPPSSKVPVPGSDVPEMIVSPRESQPSSGMPVPGSDVPEMIVSPPN